VLETPQDHAFDLNILAADQQEVSRVRRATAAVHDPASAEDDLLALQGEGRRVGLQPAVAADMELLVREDHAAHDRTACDVDRLTAGHRETADFVDARAVEDDVGVVGTGHVGLQRIPEEVQGTDPRIVDLDGQLPRLVQLQGDRLAAGDGRKDV